MYFDQLIEPWFDRAPAELLISLAAIARTPAVPVAANAAIVSEATA